MLPRGIRRLFRLDLGPGRVARAVDDELRFHFEMTVRHYMDKGMSEADARHEAERRFGDVDRTRERLEAIDRSRAERDRRADWFSAVSQDLRYAIRGLRASPGFTLVIILTLALGVGANATMFGIIDRLLFRPPAYLAAPSRTNLVYLTFNDGDRDYTSANMSYTRYLELTKYTRSFSGTAAYFYYDLAVGTGEETTEKRVGMVSASFWHFFDAPPALGRYFGPAEDRIPEGDAVAVLAYGYWQSHYGGRRDVLGRTISLGRHSYAIIGVAPAGFVGADQVGPVAFIPISSGVHDIFAGISGVDASSWYTKHNMSWMAMLVLRRPGISVEAASADLTNAFRRSYLAQQRVAPRWGGTLLRSAILPDVEWPSVLADGRVLLFTTVAAITVGILTGIAPALLARRTDVAASLKAGAREGTYHRSRTRLALLVIQGALSVVLLVGAGLFVRSLRNVHAVDLGYDTRQLLYVSAQMRGMQLDSMARTALTRDLIARARSIPGVENAAASNSVPFYWSWSQDLFTQSRDSIHGDYLYNTVTPEYFATMGARILRGRGFTDADRNGAPLVTIVSDAMARKLWPNADPLGRCLRIGADTLPCSTVVGVASNVVDRNLIDPPRTQYYSPLMQTGGISSGFMVRTHADAASVANTVRRELQREMPGVSYVSVMPLRKVLDGETRSWELGATMFVLFGGLALLLAAVGLYSVIAYNVTQRGHELGVRIALGAQSGDVLRLVVGSGISIAAAGIFIGGVIALVAGKFIAPLLYGVSPKDPLIYGVAALTLFAVAVLASFVPALRATHVDPNVALRAD